jgi:hypothetical protein
MGVDGKGYDDRWYKREVKMEEELNKNKRR